MSDNNQTSNKRIAKNTLMLYIRMFLSIVVSLYTSRVVLKTLGVEDYGIYGVVGGVVSILSFLNAAMSGATSRFLTFEMGKGDYDRLCKTFSSAMVVHIVLALIVLLLAETVGLWFLCNKMVIPENRMLAAHVVYQCSILGMMVGFTQVPYNAAIISHEKMDVYAYVELLNTFLKLAIVYLLVIGNFDKLILYAILMLIVNISIAMVYRVYCILHFSESRYRLSIDKRILRPMLSFSSWNVLSECGYSFRVYGSNIVLNMIFGPVVNAAGALAATIQGILSSFVGNVVTAVRPQIIKSYGQGNIIRTNRLITSSVRLNLFLVSLTAIPIIVDTRYIFTLWLGTVPDYAIEFCRLLLFAIFLSCVSQIATIGIHATGNLKLTSIVRNTIYISTPIIIYVILCIFHLQPAIAYVIIIISQMITCLSDLFILHRYISQIECVRIFMDFMKSVAILLLILAMMYYLHDGIEKSFFLVLFDIIIELALISTLFWIFMFRREEKDMIVTVIKKFKNKLT